MQLRGGMWGEGEGVSFGALPTSTLWISQIRLGYAVVSRNPKISAA